METHQAPAVAVVAAGVAVAAADEQLCLLEESRPLFHLGRLRSRWSERERSSMPGSVRISNDEDEDDINCGGVSYLNEILAFRLSDERLELRCGEGVDETSFRNDEEKHLGASEDRQFICLRRCSNMRQQVHQ